MTLRHLQVVTTTLLACASFAACSGSQPPAPRAFVLATLGAARDTSGNNLCQAYNSAKPVVTIGTNTANSPVRVNDGDQNAGGTVNVRCAVDGSFDLDLFAATGGSFAGSLQIAGHIGPMGGSGLFGQIVAQGLTYSQKADANGGCSITFQYMGGPVPDPVPISQGRIWAHVSCLQMLSQDGHMVMFMGGGSAQEACGGEADFIFENCS
jgi:hypothetical protein